jgi:hydroxymethylpyrimidine/phosphomethylpyrimidine kinase
MYSNILTIAGSDSGGGAGIQADLKTFSATGAYGLSVITALTAQNTVGVDAVYPVAIDFLKAQLESVQRDIRIDAIKVGMLGTPEVTEAVSAFLHTQDVPIVVDPVMVAKSGDRLLHREAIDALKTLVIPSANLVTPNLPEAADLLDVDEATDRAEMARQAEALRSLGCQAVLLKGGHLAAETSPDVLCDADQSTWFEGARVETANTHGTGCTLSSALASLLGQGMSLHHAVTEAKRYMVGAITHANALDVGSGHGPVHHFWEIWEPA